MERFCWEGYENAIIKEIAGFYRDEVNVDCSFVVEGQCLKVHKVILCACSPFFQELFKSKPGENSITLANLKYKDMKNILNYVYNGVVDVPPGDSMSFIRVAKLFQLRDLKQVSNINNIKTCMSVSNEGSDGETSHHTKIISTRSLHQNSLIQQTTGISSESRIGNNESIAEDHNQIQSSFQEMEDVTNCNNETKLSNFHIKSEIEDNQYEIDKTGKTSEKLEVLNSDLHSEVDLKLENIEEECSNDLTANNNSVNYQSIGNKSESIVVEVDVGSILPENVQEDTPTFSTYGEDHRLIAFPENMYLDEFKNERLNTIENAVKGEPIAYINSNVNNETVSTVNSEKQFYQHGKEEQTDVIVRKSRKKIVGKGHKCDTCNKEFVQLKSLQDHYLIHSGVKPYKCDYCNKLFRQKSHLQSHIFEHVGGKPFECSVCHKTFIARTTLKVHMRMHTGEKPFQCGECGKKFSYSTSLDRHPCMRNEDKAVQCKECGKRFSQTSGLQSHMLIHTGELPFQCETCGKKFRHKNNLKSHFLIHTGGKPFPCEVCGSQFRVKRDMVVHLRLHTGEKPFSCEMCSARFRMKGELRNHMFHHTGEKPFSCEKCSKGFLRKHDFQRHRKSCIKEVSSQ